MHRQYWVSDLLPPEQIPLRFRKDKFNIIECHTGSGKTVWAVNDLSKYQINRNHNHRILMITDTCSNKESLLFGNENYTQGYSKEFRQVINKKAKARGFKQIMVMTYAQLAVLLHFKHEFDWDFLDFVIFDEIHYLMKVKDFTIQDENGKDIKIEIKNIVTGKIKSSLGGNTYIIGMTATPSKVYNIQFSPVYIYTSNTHTLLLLSNLFRVTTN